MSKTTIAAFSSFGLFLGILASLEMGRRIGLARAARDPERSSKGIGAVDAAVFSLLGLLIAFTFSGAATRFENRRLLIAEETNAIGTAYLRINLLPATVQPEMRELFRQYVDARLLSFRAHEAQEADVASKHAVILQERIWSLATAVSQKAGTRDNVAVIVLPALNQMFDIATTRAVATQNHPPMIIFYLLGGMSLVSALLAGYGMAVGKFRNLLYMVVFAAVLSLTFYVILDLEFPRQGLIRIDAADQVLINLRSGM